MAKNLAGNTGDDTITNGYKNANVNGHEGRDIITALCSETPDFTADEAKEALSAIVAESMAVIQVGATGGVVDRARKDLILSAILLKGMGGGFAI